MYEGGSSAGDVVRSRASTDRELAMDSPTRSYFGTQRGPFRTSYGDCVLRNICVCDLQLSTFTAAPSQ